ncbi:hypothetical protein EYF80_003803 [Liparis tanakae]|uniref:Uncharacterized protein n=1 Tax=Liparis tanakae TaxID=230148 RepID=A0A4Z2J6Z0_9TELE|nr:hypothetical protein EYF80_003803 [Liparis tanakae]
MESRGGRIQNRRSADSSLGGPVSPVWPFGGCPVLSDRFGFYAIMKRGKRGGNRLRRSEVCVTAARRVLPKQRLAGPRGGELPPSNTTTRRSVHRAPRLSPCLTPAASLAGKPEVSRSETHEREQTPDVATTKPMPKSCSITGIKLGKPLDWCSKSPFPHDADTFLQAAAVAFQRLHRCTPAGIAGRQPPLARHHTEIRSQ